MNDRSPGPGRTADREPAGGVAVASPGAGRSAAPTPAAGAVQEPGAASQPRPTDVFPADRLAKLAAMELRHFWFAARRRLVQRLLDRWVPANLSPVADLGCGTGSMLDVLAKARSGPPSDAHLDAHRPIVLGLDGRPEGLAALLAREPGARVVRGDVTRLPFLDGSLGAALLLDVLEHVDDCAALDELRRALRRGGRVVATVPALPWLWSRRDVAAGHLRRYTRRSLRGAFERAGFEVLLCGYHHCALLPVVAVSRLLGRRDARWRDAEDDVPRLLNAAFAAVSRAEDRIGRAVPWPVGTSLHLVGVRP